MKGSSLVDHIRVSLNHEARLGNRKPSLLILHYTAMESGEKAINWLCTPDSKVSCHYLVDVDGAITQMVDEDRRAWHAGVSSWHGNIDINSASIGIEIQNAGHNAGLPAFPDVQMQRVAALCLDIMVRHHMPPHHVIGHSDVAPGRKIDPGEAFPWAALAELGIGQCVTASKSDVEFTEHSAREVLAALGYGLDDQPNRMKIVLEAVQRRYRQNRVDGVLDAETSGILQRLLASLPAFDLLV